MARLKSTPAAGSFEGFGLWTLDFYRHLAQNQNRAWFHEQREVYDDQIRTPMIALLVELTQR